MKILVTGGAGFIGSHTVVELISAGFDVVVVDNLINSSKSVIKSLEAITKKQIPFYKIDVQDKKALTKVFKKFKFDAVIHFAALKAVGESVEVPLRYYQNNVCGSLTLFEVMQAFQIKHFVFSSSASVYGQPEHLPITENMPLKPESPYAVSKLMVEQILQSLAETLAWSVINLRYFNPVGAHVSALIGENPKDVPNNLVPFICQVAAKKTPLVRVYGNDYGTVDGTGVRDYIHVVDLARAHVAALRKVFNIEGMETYNLGTGRGHSVLEVINTFQKVNGVEVPFKIVARRPGDVASCYADVSLAERELGWRAELNLEAMLKDAWRWQQNNL